MKKPEIDLTISQVAEKLETPALSNKVGNFLLEESGDDQIITVIKIVADEEDFTEDFAKSICLGLYFLGNKQGVVDDVQIQLQTWSDAKGGDIETTEIYNHGQSLAEASEKLALACMPLLEQYPGLYTQAEITLATLFEAAKMVAAEATATDIQQPKRTLKMKLKTPASKRILFLSIDGSIDTLRSRISGFASDPVGATAINRYIQQINSQVVIVCAEHVYAKFDRGDGTLFERRNIVGAELHQDHSAFIGGKTYQEGINSWIQRNGLEEGTEHLVICPETVNIAGVIAIKTDRDGLSSEHLIYLDYLRGETRLDEAKRAWECQKSPQPFPGE